MICTECQQRNPASNKFCRECGAKIAPPAGSVAAAEVARADAERRAERGAILLSDAHSLAEQGKYIGAIPVAVEAVAAVPFSASAHSFLVTLYEHTDQRELAVAAQGKVVELLPNAPKEAARLEQLKRGERTSLPPGRTGDASHVPTLRGTMPGTAPLPSWFPFVAATVGGGFALFLGFMAIAPRPALKKPSVAVASPVPEPSDAPVASNAGAVPPPPVDPNRGSDPFVPLAAPVASPLPRPASPTTVAAGAPLPFPKSLTQTRRSSVAPVVVPPEIVKNGTGSDAPLPAIVAAPPSTDNGSGFGTGERVSATPPSPVGTPAKRTGYMKISVSQPGSTAAIVAAPPQAPAPDMETNPLDRARTLQGLERFTEAIAAYREAIASGASLGETQQAIALCYQRADDSANARVAYLQAIAAYKAQIASGRNPGAAQRGLNTCQAALEVLSGG